MKKLFIASLFVLTFSLSAKSQDFKPFRVDAGIGYIRSFTEIFSTGALVYLEPKYEVAPQFSVGMRLELSGINGKIGGKILNIDMNSSCMITGDYYFNNNVFRPFVGLGSGVFLFGGGRTTLWIGEGPVLDEIEVTVERATNFAVMARIGFDVYHFRLTALYNHAFTAEKAFNYIALAAGFYIGGGKK